MARKHLIATFSLAGVMRATKTWVSLTTHRNHTTIFFSVLIVPSCSTFTPTAQESFAIKTSTSPDTLLLCMKETIAQLSSKEPWFTRISRQNLKPVLFETENFDHPHLIGFSTQITYEHTTGTGVITVKAIGPYFVDLGAHSGAQRVKAGILKCTTPQSHY
jgi:hypothetical protein